MKTEEQNNQEESKKDLLSLPPLFCEKVPFKKMDIDLPSPIIFYRQDIEESPEKKAESNCSYLPDWELLPVVPPEGIIFKLKTDFINAT